MSAFIHWTKKVITSEKKQSNRISFSFSSNFVSVTTVPKEPNYLHCWLLVEMIILSGFYGSTYKYNFFE